MGSISVKHIELVTNFQNLLEKTQTQIASTNKIKFKIRNLSYETKRTSNFSENCLTWKNWRAIRHGCETKMAMLRHSRLVLDFIIFHMKLVIQVSYLILTDKC